MTSSQNLKYFDLFFSQIILKLLKFELKLRNDCVNFELFNFI
jgi:hypothetical protein